MCATGELVTMANTIFGIDSLKRNFFGLTPMVRTILCIMAGALAAGLLVMVLSFAGTRADAATLDQFDIARQRHLNDLTGTIDGAEQAGDLSAAKVRITATAQTAWSTLTTTAPASGELWADIPTATSSQQITAAYKRVLSMAVAYKTPGSSLYGNLGLKADTIAAADWLIENRYNSAITKDTGWWFYEIGIPMALNDITTLLYDELTTAQKSTYMNAIIFFAPSVKNSGANRVWSSYVVATTAMLTKNSTKIAEGAGGVDRALAIVSTSDGFYADGSFVQHRYFAYTGGYGLSMIDILSKLYYYLHGSTWQIKTVAGLSIYDRIEDAYAPVTWCGSVHSSVRGREIAREAAQDDMSGIFLQTAVLRLASIAPASKVELANGWAKTWLECNKNNPNTIENQGSVSDIVRARLVLTNGAIAINAHGAGSHSFTGMDRYSYMTNNYGFALGMNSTRIAAFESFSGENRRGWYTSDGATYFYSGNGLQYANNYWATTNSYRIPGTTEDTMKRGSSAGASARSAKTFVGSLSTPSAHAGVATMDFKSYTGNLSAKKAWFSFDGKVVALSAGITSSSMTGTGYDGKTRRIETTVDNRQALTADEALRINGTTVANGTTNTQVARWASISGQGESMGYVFPVATTVSAQSETRQGTWYDVGQRYGTTEVKTNRHMTLNINHGVNPTNGNYAYIVLPNATETQTAAYAQNQDVSILANLSQLMAVYDTASKTTGVVSYVNGINQAVENQDGSVSFAVKGAGLVTVQQSGSNVIITASDPTKVATTPICIALNQATNGIVSRASTFTVQENTVPTGSTQPVTTACFNPTYTKGKASSVTLVSPSADQSAPINQNATFEETSSASVSGTLTVGSTLTANAPTLSPVPSSQTYQWLRNGVAISGAISNTYTIVSADAGNTLSFSYSASRAGYTSYSTSASATSTVAASTINVFTSTPKPGISGTLIVGSKLTATTIGWVPTPTKFTYKWLRNGVIISYATASTYTLTSTDYNTRISVRVIAYKTGYKTSNYQTSPQTLAITR